jgi:hypothetical protein
MASIFSPFRWEVAASSTHDPASNVSLQYNDDEVNRQGTYEEHQTLSERASDQGMTSLQAELTERTLLLVSNHLTVKPIQIPLERCWLMHTLGIL